MTQRDRASSALPDRVWILTHPAWKDDATRQMYEVILNEGTAKSYVQCIGDPNVAQSFAGFEISEYQLVKGVQS
jgi:hypothetical protein